MDSRSVDKARFEQLLKDATKDVVAVSLRSKLKNGRFSVDCRLGSGGMGVVYEATDNVHDTKIALKVLSEINPAGIYRLKQEFRALADVVHPNLVVLHELFFDKGLWFFTMDLVVGQPLLDHMNVEFDLGRLKRVFLELASGINAIHAAGKLHRDLKPNNVLVTPKGHVTILDFGLVSDQELGGRGQTIIAEGVSGTPTYMAPEQAAAEPASPATDWYAFGAMLFEVLTGRPPFEDTPHRVLERKQTETAPRASAVCPGIPEDLDQLCTDLLHLDQRARPAYDKITRVLGETAAPSTVLVRIEEPPFIGRVSELAMLEEAFKATDSGSPVVAFVHGPSGMGKSTLVDRFLDRIEDHYNAVILRGRCYERESVPFKACDSLVDDLSRYLRRLPDQHAARLMPRNVASLAKIFPVLNRSEVVRQTRQRHRLPPNPNELRRVAFLAAKEMLLRISSQDPLILYVDDLQWGDVDGIKMLSSLVTPPDAPSLLLICSYRTEDRESSVELNLLGRRVRDAEDMDVRDIFLDQLSEEESCQLAENLLSSRTKGLAPQIAKEAQGSPFFISELARYAESVSLQEDEARLDRAIEHRVAGLSRRVRDLMELIAVSGHPITETFLESVVNKGNISGPLRTLESMRLIRQKGGNTNRITCYHDRIREAVISGLSRERAKECHKRLAGAMESEKSPDPIGLTEHLLGAGERAKAGEYAAKAARLAGETLAFDNAARFYRIALSYSPGGRASERQLQTELGDVLAHAGRGAEAANAFIKAAKGAQLEDALALRCRAAEQWIRTGHMTEGSRELQTVLKAVGLKLYSNDVGSLMSLFYNRALLKVKGQPDKLETAPPVSPRKLLEIRVCEATFLGLWATDTLQAASYCTRYLRLAFQAGSVPDIVMGLTCEAAFRVVEGIHNLPLAQRYMEQAESLAEHVDDPVIRAHLQLAHGMINFAHGNFAKAIPYLERAERQCLEECTRKTSTLEMTQIFLGASYSRLGRWAILQEQWDRWVEDAEEMGNLHHLAVCRMWMMGTIRWLAVDQPETALGILEQGLREWPWPHFDLQKSQALNSKGFIYLYQGEWQKAFDVCKELHQRMVRSNIAKMELVRVFYSTDYAYTAVGLAASAKDNAEPLRVVKEQLVKLSKEKSVYGPPALRYLRGVVECITGDTDQGILLLKDAVSRFEEGKYNLMAAAIKRRLGKLIGGDEGNTLFAEGTKVMEEEQIVDPERITMFIAPGFDK